MASVRRARRWPGRGLAWNCQDEEALVTDEERQALVREAAAGDFGARVRLVEATMGQDIDVWRALAAEMNLDQQEGLEAGLPLEALPGWCP